MADNSMKTTIEIIYTVLWIFFTSYYISWGEGEELNVAALVDNSGWIPDGVLAEQAREMRNNITGET